jgi:hypothetical protein
MSAEPRFRTQNRFADILKQWLEQGIFDFVGNSGFRAKIKKMNPLIFNRNPLPDRHGNAVSKKMLNDCSTIFQIVPH